MGVDEATNYEVLCPRAEKEMKNGLIVYFRTLNGKIFFGNEKFLNMRDIKSNIDLSYNIDKIFKPTELEEIYNEDKLIASNKRTMRYVREVEMIKDNIEKYRITKYPLFDKANNVTGLIVTLEKYEQSA